MTRSEKAIADAMQATEAFDEKMHEFFRVEQEWQDAQATFIEALKDSVRLWKEDHDGSEEGWGAALIDAGFAKDPRSGRNALVTAVERSAHEL